MRTLSSLAISLMRQVSIGSDDGPPPPLRIKLLETGYSRYLEPAVHHTLNFRAGFSP